MDGRNYFSLSSIICHRIILPVISNTPNSNNITYRLINTNIAMVSEQRKRLISRSVAAKARSELG